MKGEISERLTIGGLCENYRGFVKDILESEKHLCEVLAEARRHDVVYDSSYYIRDFVGRMIKDARDHTWRKLFEVSGLRYVLSISRQNKFEKFLKGGRDGSGRGVGIRVIDGE